MKKIFFSLLTFISIITYSQTAEEIADKFNVAMGGIDSLNNIKTLKYTGVITVQGNDLPVITQIINKQAMRTDVDVMGQTTVTNCYKDGKGWKINPLQGVELATDVEGKELSDFKSNANIASSFQDYKSLGHKLELKGEEEVEGVKTFKIKLITKEDNWVSYYYINKADNLLVKSVTEREINGSLKEIEMYYSNLKEYGGLKFYTTRTQKMSGQVFQTIQFTDIELNIPIDEKIFDK